MKGGFGLIVILVVSLLIALAVQTAVRDSATRARQEQQDQICRQLAASGVPSDSPVYEQQC